MKNKTPLMLFGLVALLLVIVLAVRVLAAGEGRPIMFLASSGGAAGETSGNVKLYGSLGQPVAGRTSDRRLCSGFWCGPLAPSTIFLPLVLRNYVEPIVLGDASDLCEQANPIELFPYQYIENFDHEDDDDWYQFNAVAGVTYRIETGNLEPNADTSLYLYNVNCGGQLEKNDDIDYPTNVASRIIWTAPATGIYYIRVESYDWQKYGAQTGYTVRVQIEP